ncbi:MAG: recombination protein RecR [Clostridiales bacterium]|nr:recombination protein RecR [Clostridiales bacterium]MBQ2818694.1 recombination protein RecR [Clostridia bacterium]MBQ4638161.1 recombination protein RecR [Clostridia bacterium]
MAVHPSEAIASLVAHLSKLPGIGSKTAQRLAYHILSMNSQDVRELAVSIWNAKKNTKLCSVCGSYCDDEVCSVCEDPTRDHRTVCVVRDPRDVAALERMRDYRGVYHVLHGTISPINGVGPSDIRIKELMGRLADIDEVIIATNPDIEGEATAAYIARMIKPMGIKVTRIAHGMPIGADLEYTDEKTISRAMEGRREM